MKLAAGIVLFLLCGLAGEQKSRRLVRRSRALSNLGALIRQISDRQIGELIPFAKAAQGCPPSQERDYLLSLTGGQAAGIMPLTPEEEKHLLAYARRDSRSTADLKRERDGLLALLNRAAEGARQELQQKGQVYRSVGYLTGMAVLLLVL